jgi:hypothetical protein
MPSQPMRDSIDALRNRQKASASQVPPTLEERRAAFVPGDRLHAVPDDVLVREVTAGGVPAQWLDAPGADSGRVLLLPARRRLRARVASQRRRASRPAGTGQRDAGAVP